MAQRNENKGRHFWQMAANGIVWTGILLSGAYLLTHFQENAQYEKEESSGIEIEGQAAENRQEPVYAQPVGEDMSGTDTAGIGAAVYDYTGYLDIYLQMDTGSVCQDIKLYMKRDECYFFLPACADFDCLTLQYDESEYEVSIDGQVFASKDKLADIGLLQTHVIDIRSLPGGKTQDEESANTEYSLQFMQSETIPTVFIETANETMEYLNESKENKEPGEMVCILADGELDSAGALSIHARGSSSFGAEKKSYRISMEEAVDILSMGMATDWILQANAFDMTRIRNRLAYQMADELELPYAVASLHADVYFNGEYAGNYLICEPIEVEENRIEIAGDGSYLFSIDTISDGDDSFVDQYGQTYDIRYPKENSEDSVAWLAERMNTIENLVSECDTREKYQKLQEYIDIDSFVIMYLMNAVTNEIDANARSTFYYIDGKSGKLYAGPAWDYDRSWGNDDFNGAYANYDAYYDGLPEWLSEIPYFREAIQEKVEDSKAILEKQEKMAKDMAEEIRASVNMELVIPENTAGACLNIGSFHDNVEYLEYYIGQRISLVTDFVMNPELYHKIHLENEKTGRVYWVKDGETIPESVIRNICAHYEWADLSFESGTVFWEGYPVLSDLVLYPVKENPVQEINMDTEESETEEKAAVRNTVNMEGISMGLLLFIILLAPGFIALLISQNGKPEKDSHMILLLMHYICFDFLILFLVYGSIYVMKGSITLSLTASGAGENVYTFENINVTFLFMLLELIWACVLGFAVRIYRKGKKR